MQMHLHGKLLEYNPLNNVSYQSPDMINEQGSSRHHLISTPYFDLNTVLNKQGSYRRIVSDVLHYHPGVV
jgi:hypothetical protein